MAINEDEVEESEVEEVETQETQTETETEEDTTDWKAEALRLQGINKRYETKLAKAKEVKTEVKPKGQKSDGLGYGEKAFLTSNGIKGSKEFEFVQDELSKSGEDLEGLLENDYFKTRLSNFRALNKTAEAIPKGSHASGVTTDSVEYWMAKPIEEVPVDMRTKVVNAKLAKEKTKGVFYNS